MIKRQSKREDKKSKKIKEIAYKIAVFFSWNYDGYFRDVCKTLSEKHGLNYYSVIYLARQMKQCNLRISGETDFDGLARLEYLTDLYKLKKGPPSEASLDRFLDSIKAIKSSIK